MNIIKTLLKDYLEDKSDDNLELFTANIAPNFKMGKKKKLQLIAMIGKYEKEPSKVRLDIILNFLGADVKPQKISTKKASKKEVVVPEKEETELQLNIRQLQEEYKGLVQSIRDAKGNPDVIKALQPEMDRINSEIDNAISLRNKEIRKNMDPNAQRNEEKRIVKRAFGDPEEEGSISWRLLNGKIQSFKVNSEYDPAKLIQMLFRQHNKEPYEYSAGLLAGQTWQVRRGNVTEWNQGTESI